MDEIHQPLTGVELDLSWAWRMSTHLCQAGRYGSNTRDLEESLERRLDELVKESGDCFWAQVTALADALASGVTLTGDEVAHTLRRVAQDQGLRPLTWTFKAVELSGGESIQ